MLRVVLAMLALVVAGCGHVGDDSAPRQGTEPRLVVLSPALAAIIDDLGLADRVVGRHGYDLVLDPSIPVCGEQQAIDYEALVRVEPTHLLIEWGSRELPSRLTELADRRGWAVRGFQTLTLDDVDRATRELEALFPQAVAGPRIERFHELTAGPPDAPRFGGRVLLVMNTSPQIIALGPGSAHHELLVRTGGVPAIEDGSPYMPLHAEDVLRLAPDAVIVIEAGEASPDARLGVLDGLAIPAIESGRVAVIADRLALLPSTRLADVADEMRRILDSWSRD